MYKRILDIRLILGYILAHALIYFSFNDKTIFWYIFSGSVLVLIVFAMFQGEVDDAASFIQYIFLGAITGILLYFIFWLGFQAIQILNLPFEQSIKKLYRWYAPHAFWQYIALILIAAPGEELFWRGFIQKKLLKYFKPIWSILLRITLRFSSYLFRFIFISFCGPSFRFYLGYSLLLEKKYATCDCFTYHI